MSSIVSPGVSAWVKPLSCRNCPWPGTSSRYPPFGTASENVSWLGPPAGGATVGPVGTGVAPTPGEGDVFGDDVGVVPGDAVAGGRGVPGDGLRRGSGEDGLGAGAAGGATAPGSPLTRTTRWATSSEATPTRLSAGPLLKIRTTSGAEPPTG